MEFCYTFDGYLTNDDSQSGTMLRYALEASNEKTILFKFDNIQTGAVIDFDLVEHAMLNDLEPTPLRITLVNASKLNKEIRLRDVVLPWLFDGAFGEPGYSYHLRAGESVTLQTAFNSVTGRKSWTKDVSLVMRQEQA